MKFLILVIILFLAINCKKVVNTPTQAESKVKINTIISTLFEYDNLLGVNNYTECGNLHI